MLLLAFLSVYFLLSDNAQSVSFLSQPYSIILCLAQSTNARFECAINRGGDDRLDQIDWYISVGGGEFESVKGRPGHVFISPFGPLLLTIGRLKISGVSAHDDGNRYRCHPKYTNLISRAATLNVPVPPNIDLQSSGVCVNDFVVSWTPASNEKGLSYAVTISRSDVVNDTGTVIDSIRENFHNFTGLLSDTAYIISVVSILKTCEGNPSRTMVTTLSAKKGVQRVPNLHSPTKTNATITVGWNDADNYDCGPTLYYKGNILNSIYIIGPTDRRFKFSNLMSNISYVISIAAVNRIGTGPTSTITVTTLGNEEGSNGSSDGFSAGKIIFGIIVWVIIVI